MNEMHGAQIGETAIGPGFVIAAVLDWAGICRNERGYLTIGPDFMIETKSKPGE
jgi:hypothetical protein